MHGYCEHLLRNANGQILCIFDSYLPRTRPYFHFWMITLVNTNGLSPNLVCALILWTSALVLPMGKFRAFLTELSALDTSIFSFLDNNFNKYLWIFTKLGMCIDVLDICFGIANGQFHQFFTKLSASKMIMVGYYCFTFYLS